ncbi:MAG: hypothetical protein A2W28_02125 [Gammaproteobacteria bacterium RBG_16_51_14]|nr:MAG: hypothetical protein A2W28_02125 [Gammaproteobacteria bacterium RBG_16_51_14]
MSKPADNVYAWFLHLYLIPNHTTFAQFTSNESRVTGDDKNLVPMAGLENFVGNEIGYTQCARRVQARDLGAPCGYGLNQPARR